MSAAERPAGPIARQPQYKELALSPRAGIGAASNATIKLGTPLAFRAYRSSAFRVAPSPPMPVSVTPALPRFAQIEPIGRCNLACRMCTVNERGDAVAELSLERFGSLLCGTPRGRSEPPLIAANEVMNEVIIAASRELCAALAGGVGPGPTEKVPLNLIEVILAQGSRQERSGRDGPRIRMPPTCH